MPKITLCFVMLCSGTFAFGGDDKEAGKPRKDVKVKITFPKEANFADPKIAGGEVGKIIVKVEVTNVGKEDIGLSSVDFSAKVKGFMGGTEKLNDALLLKKGQTIKQERPIILHTVIPEDGQILEVDFYAYGHKNSGKVKAKVKK